ncbi:DUF3307 domain-containing protein [candidate division WOR-3 bacterium]|nr:DUF3307 domain-containing protein [candidate division WOR-3 bacterium]
MPIQTSVAFFLIVAHFIGDFSFQPSWLSAEKRKAKHVLLGHCIICAGIVGIVLIWAGLFAPWKLFALTGIHYIIDWKKHKIIDKHGYSPRIGLGD